MEWVWPHCALAILYVLAGENHLAHGYIVTDNTKELLRNHLEETGGKVRMQYTFANTNMIHIRQNYTKTPIQWLWGGGQWGGEGRGGHTFFCTLVEL